MDSKYKYNRVIKNRLFREGIKGKLCERCKLSDWMGEPIPLELDHIDGNPENNELDNLHILCSNCHSQKTYKTRRDSALERRIEADPMADLYEDYDYESS